MTASVRKEVSVGSARGPTEIQLKAWMTATLDGDSTSQAALLRAIAPMLKSFYRRRMRDPSDEIEDLVQETLIAVHSRRASFDRSRPFTPWLYAIARYKMIDHLRQRYRYETTGDLDEILSVEGFEQSSNARLDIERLLGRLPAKQARAIMDTRIVGLSVAESAKNSGIGESDVKVSVHRGIKALTQHIAGEPG